MEKTRKIIQDNLEIFPEFYYYFTILDEINENIRNNPDISIESCKSLVEGISRKILDYVDIDYLEEGRQIDSPKMLIKKVMDFFVLYDPNLHEGYVSLVADLIKELSDLRNKRGDISHGRSAPKKFQSDSNMSIMVAEITDILINHILTIFFSEDIPKTFVLVYESNEEFNNYLDEDNEIEGIKYSKALFDQDIVLYKEKLKEYKLENNLEI